MIKLMHAIDKVNYHIGRVMGWLMLGLVLLVTGDVISRYLFQTGWVIIQELEWWIFSIIFLMCAGYTFLYNEHVRVDIIYSRVSRKWQNIIDIVCAFIFLFPMCALVILTSLWFIEESWKVREFSPDPGGMPAYYVLKSFIPAGFALLALQGLVQLLRSVLELKGHKFEVFKDSMAARAEEQSRQEIK